MALNRQFHDAPGPWRSKKDELAPDFMPKYLPYRPDYRHHIWYLDIRYLVKLDERWIYSICILEGYSRTILAGMASEHQDLTAVLQVLYVALAEYGYPELIVSDNAKVFNAYDYHHILEGLGIEPKYIEKGRPWQNLIEAQFKIQLRLADFKFEQAQTVEEVQNLHAEFIDTFNTTAHYAHQDRDDGRRTPMAVLAWVRGRAVDREKLRRLFQRLQFTRSVNRYGFVSIQPERQERCAVASKHPQPLDRPDPGPASPTDPAGRRPGRVRRLGQPARLGTNLTTPLFCLFCGPLG
jgi:hypothetical protein